MERNDKRTLVLGLGNVLMGDEGVGVRAVEFFEEHYALPPEVECADGGTRGVMLLGMVSKFDQLVIVDAVLRDAPAPGTAKDRILVLTPEDLKETRLRTSAHGIGVGELLELAEFEGKRPRASLVGIKIREAAPGIDLSPEAKKVLPEAAGAVAEALERFGVCIRRMP